MRRLWFILNNVEESLVICLLAIMVTVILLQVFCRYVLNNPLTWPEEVARFTLIWITLLGASVGIKRGSHFKIDFLVSSLPLEFRRYIVILVASVITIFLLVVLCLGVEYVIETWEVLSSALSLPIRYVFFALPIGSALMLIRLIQFTLKEYRKFSVK